MVIVTGVIYLIAWRKKETVMDSSDYSSVVDSAHASGNAYAQQVAQDQAKAYAQDQYDQGFPDAKSGLSGITVDDAIYNDKDISFGGGDVSYGGTTEV